VSWGAVLRGAPCLALLAALAALSGCSTFERDWRVQSSFPPEPGLQGCWQGVWASQVSGHTDSLRCIIGKAEDGTYRARFKAKYRKVLSFGYTVPLKVERRGDKESFQGQANLGWLAGGVYHYKGSSDSTNFQSTYSCKYDHGTFRMLKAGL